MRDRVRRSSIDRRRHVGPPPGADPDALADVAQTLLGVPARRYHHASVSGSREATAFVVWMADSSGRTVRLFFKDVDLGPKRYPAIVGFPGRPGMPEAAFYGKPHDRLRRFMPRAYAHVELEREQHYQYFLADLNATHRRGFKPDDLLSAVDQLLDVSAGIGAWIEANSAEHLIQYDGTFPEAFVGHAEETLARFNARREDARAARLLGRWDKVAELYLAETPEVAEDPIHGDFRPANLFHDRSDTSSITAVDWEYAGLGWIHNDLVSLLRASGPEAVEPALARIATARPQRSPDEHWRLYQRCRIERGLIDLALGANRLLALSDPSTLPDTHFQRINDAVGLLTDQPADPIL